MAVAAAFTTSTPPTAQGTAGPCLYHHPPPRRRPPGPRYCFLVYLMYACRSLHVPIFSPYSPHTSLIYHTPLMPHIHIVHICIYQHILTVTYPLTYLLLYTHMYIQAYFYHNILSKVPTIMHTQRERYIYINTHIPRITYPLTYLPRP